MNDCVRIFGINHSEITLNRSPQCDSSHDGTITFTITYLHAGVVSSPFAHQNYIGKYVYRLHF